MEVMDLATKQEVVTIDWVIRMLQMFPAAIVIDQLEQYKSEIMEG